MNIEYYRNFIAIVEAGSISAAAKRVAVAQPALSNQLKTLQKKFGTPLLNLKRGGHTVELTEAYMIDIKILLMPIFIYMMLLKKYFPILIKLGLI